MSGKVDVPRLIVIAGPTASGKTGLSIRLAHFFKCPILSFDSRQCYQEMSIGTAVPTVAEQEGIPHFFIHSHSIHQPQSAADFESYALYILEEHFRNHPLMIAVGGTGLYLKALLSGLDEMPNVPESIVQEVQNMYKQKGLAFLQQRIKEMDSTFYLTGEIQNPHRLMRALSFVMATGQSILLYRSNSSKKRMFQPQLYGIQLPKEELYIRINKRVDNMMAEGLLAEAMQLYPFRHLKPLQTVGYQELFNHLDGKDPLEFAVEKIKQHTRNYAKRQITWFQKMDGIKWLSADDIYKECLLMNA